MLAPGRARNIPLRWIDQPPEKVNREACLDSAWLDAVRLQKIATEKVIGTGIRNSRAKVGVCASVLSLLTAGTLQAQPVLNADGVGSEGLADMVVTACRQAESARSDIGKTGTGLTFLMINIHNRGDAVAEGLN